MSGKGCVLVTGGAGYVGSHAALALLDHGWGVVVLDNLRTGRRELVPRSAAFVHGDAGDFETVTGVLETHGVRAVMHFAGRTVVPESLADPLGYYHANTATSRTLLAAAARAGVERFVFSSSAAVYGEPEFLPVPESAPTRPISPYGTSKLMTETMLRDAAAAGPLRYAALRYFNVAGADPHGRAGQCTPGATHLIKVACEAALGRRDKIAIHGEDYDTPDGTCIRDFIHVTDLAQAHVAALEHLEAGGESLTLNCGYGRGMSVREVIETTRRLAGRPFKVERGPRRNGDIVAMVADSSEIRRVLGWKPLYDDIEAIVGSALDWERKLGAYAALPALASSHAPAKAGTASKA